MSDTSTPARPYKTGRKPPYPPGHPRRLALPWLDQVDPEVAPEVPVVYPVNVYGNVSGWPMWGNGPDTTNTTTVNPEGTGQPVGDCFYAADANNDWLNGNPLSLTTNTVVGGAYSHYEADSQGVPLGQEQDDGVVMSDACIWCLTHDWNGNAVPLGQGIFIGFLPVKLAGVAAAVAKYQRPVLLGVNLTDQDQQTFPTWDESPSNPPDQNEGHVVLCGKLDAPVAGAVFGPGGPISWTQEVNASANWMNACPEEAWLPLTLADRDKMGAAAFDAALAQMATLPGFQGEPPPATPPVPAPPPVVPPVAPPVVTPPPNPGPPPQPSENLLQELLEWCNSAWAWIEHHLAAEKKEKA